MNSSPAIQKTKLIALVGIGKDAELFESALNNIADIVIYNDEKAFFASIFKATQPDLCFMDMKRDGRKLKYQLLSSLRNVNIPVIGLLDENDELGVELKTLSYGAVDVIRTPYSAEIIKTKT